jgi:GT2 family glycosyltransferase
MTTCTILILTYKGKHHLQFLLPTVQDAILQYRGSVSFKVLIVDNGCDEETREYCRVAFPLFQYEFSKENDFLFSLNDYIRDLRSEYVFLLNDDIRLDKEILNELMPVMLEADDSIFGISCKNLDWEGINTTSAVRVLNYSKGWVSNFYSDIQASTTKYTLYPAGGSALFRTRYFNELKGFDSLYRPAYYEDNDLGIRAWQNGWKVIYHPQAIVCHREGGSTKDHFRNKKLERTIYTNMILCMVKNTRRDGFLLWFFLLLPYRLGYNLIYNRNYFLAMLHAIRRLPMALKRRRNCTIKVMDAVWAPLLDQAYIGPADKEKSHTI